MLTAWINNPEGELQVLERAMSILDDHPVLSGSLLDPAYPWEPDTELRLSLDHLGMEDGLRLWDALSPSFRLSTPYILRTVRISPTEGDLVPPVDTATFVFDTAGAP